MSVNTMTIALLACCVVWVVASSVVAAPMVAMSVVDNVGGTGNKALDFFYASTPGAEFLNYRLHVNNTDGTKLLDPNRLAWDDFVGDAVDTWMNTVYSLNEFGRASFVFNSYRPTRIGGDLPARAEIDWSVFDTGEGDTNNIEGHPQPPYHLARILAEADAQGTATFTAFDTLTLGTDGQPAPTVFQFIYGVIPEPSSLLLLT
jgi:hypothetical protein